MNENMLPVGTLLMNGVYRIEKQIGSGGFGNTYVVLHQGMGVRRALKEFFMKEINLRDGSNVTVSIPGKKSTFEAQRSKFKKEAQRLRKIDNPHIVKVHDLFEENGTVYYVMDFIDGDSLDDIVKKNGPMSEGKAMDIFCQMLDVLKVVHGQEPMMLHLDIKPANIMVDKKGNAYLLDFGSSKQIDLSGGLTTDGSGITLSKGYAPSELMDQNRNHIGPWTDLYELGGTLYYLLTGQQPPSVSEIQEYGSTAFCFPESVSTPTCELITWLMALSRSKRPKSVSEVKDWLMASSPTPEPEPTPELEPTPNPDEEDETVLGNQEDGDDGGTVLGGSPDSHDEPTPPKPEPNKPATANDSKSNNNLLMAILLLTGVAIVLFLIFGNTKFNTQQAPVEDTDSIAEIVDSVVDSGGAVDGDLPTEIEKISQYIIDGNVEKLAYVTEYPLLRNYPLKDIKNTDEMIAYFNTLFDTSIKNRLREAKEDDWSSMGYRGYCFGNGDIWINEDYQLYSVNYMSAKEKTLYQQKVKEDLETLPASLREGGWMPYSCYMDTEDGSVLRIDKEGEKLRLCVFNPGKPLNEPSLCLYGKRDIQGSMALESDEFTDGKISYTIDASGNMEDGEKTVSVEDKSNKKSWSHAIRKCYWLDLIVSFGTKSELPQDMESIEASLKYMGEVIQSAKLDRVIKNLIANMILVEGTSFLMGGDTRGGFADEMPRHVVNLSNYYIGKTEVTQEEWQAVMGTNPSAFKGLKRPVESVSWNDCQKFIGKLNTKTGMKFRLPTEAEWEFAARGGKKSKKFKYAGGDNLNQVGWFVDNGTSTTHEVGLLKPNELGLYDMSGNVYEWCQDWYGGYNDESEYNPTGPQSGEERVLRGGCYSSESKFMHVSCRSRVSQDNRYRDVGLRLVY